MQLGNRRGRAEAVPLPDLCSTHERMAAKAVNIKRLFKPYAKPFYSRGVDSSPAGVGGDITP